ncbi:uncharacterized protein [Clytia hemisphaerica]|uniref:uncharacterized protein n=1 Tax=Clytia hemisphaerica TaxID=252671 RepID=UPI0034D7A84B
MSTSNKKKKSGCQNRKFKKMRLDEEAKYKVQMDNYFKPKSHESTVNNNISETLIQNQESSSQSFSEQLECSSGPGVDLEPQMIENCTDFEPRNASVNFSDDISSMEIEDTFMIEHRDLDPQLEHYDHQSESSEDDQHDETKSDDIEKVFNVSSVLGKSLSHEEKLAYLNQTPCQPSKTELSKRQKMIKNVNRHCSETVFFRKDGSNRSWLTYSLESNALYCIPCLLFSDETSRGESQRKNQGSAFVKEGFTNWCKQYTSVPDHEASTTHINSKLAQVMFQQKKSMRDILDAQDKKQEELRKLEVESNRKILSE